LPVYARWCPSCGTRIATKDYGFTNHQSFSCPACSAPLRVAVRFVEVSMAASSILAVGFAWYLGLNGIRFALACIAAAPLALVILHYILGFFFPFKVELRTPTDFPVRFPDRPTE
jgi:predicted nucleic acid-binding Zn ribbon protein